MLAGEGVEAFRRDPTAALLAKEIATEFQLGPGDLLTLTVYPDDEGRTRTLKLRVAGVFRSFPPTEPYAEVVISAAALPAPVPNPDFYLARVAPTHSPTQVADELRRGAGFSVTTISQLTLQERRSLTALNLRGLSRLEAVAAGLVAAVGVAVLGAFLVLERRREMAVLRAVGATTRQLLTGPAIEGAIAVFGSLAIGIPIGVGLSVITIRVLGLFFVLPPPLVVLPTATLGGLAGFTVLTSALALAVTLRVVARRAAASVLREP
jgi:putative ABC transport system permease protein